MKQSDVRPTVNRKARRLMARGKTAQAMDYLHGTAYKKGAKYAAKGAST